MVGEEDLHRALAKTVDQVENRVINAQPMLQMNPLSRGHTHPMDDLRIPKQRGRCDSTGRRQAVQDNMLTRTTFGGYGLEQPDLSHPA
ncbi:MAG: hypothetical protein AUH69_05575 [Actinobacteria bacterium 13_1_40CM_4_65_12]|nr:MAG: hypothetical protein AUH69_05575 [Actinobacteria bacterium 13_1_40CM_4_65_12]